MVKVSFVHAKVLKGKSWEDRIAELQGLTEKEKGKVYNLIVKQLPAHDREAAVPKTKAMALASLKERLEEAQTGELHDQRSA
jgi:hypothetical protein